jgi:hypothetical protein
MKDLTEKIRVRIMQEAYDLADRNDSEGYNSVKVMCSDVLTLLPRREWVGLTEEEILAEIPITTHRPATSFARAIEAKLKEKNHG